MKITKNALAGSLESSDIMITVAANEKDEINIALESNVEKQFGHQIRHVILGTLQQFGITSVNVIAVDKGALDCTIQARTLTAIHRSLGKEDYDWKEIDSWNV